MQEDISLHLVEIVTKINIGLNKKFEYINNGWRNLQVFYSIMEALQNN